MTRCWSCEVLAVIRDVRFQKRDSCDVVTSLACWLWNVPQNCTRPCSAVPCAWGTNLLILHYFFRQYQYAISILGTGRTAVSHIAFYQLLYLESFVSFPFSPLPPHAARILLNNNFTRTLSFQKTVSFSNINFLVGGSFSLFSHLLLFSLLSPDLFLPSFFPSLWGFCENVFWYLWQTC